nr:MAG TPA: hypothetical protein [Caudoviricetes sp.]
MEQTVVTIDIDKKSLREAMTRMIEYITLNSPEPDEFGQEERIEYNLALEVLFTCLRQAF